MPSTRLIKFVKLLIFLLGILLFYQLFSSIWSMNNEYRQYVNSFKSHASKFNEESDSNKDTKPSLSLKEKLKPNIVRHDQPEVNENGDIIWDDIGLAKNNKDVQIREEGYRQFAFNSLVSNRIGYKRDIPDTRHKECRKKTYEDELPTASVIICFHQEEFMTLLRTIYSVINRSPKHLLKEIILVNDHSHHDITSNLTDHIQQAGLKDLVKLFTPSERLGLIRARIYGSQKAVGDVLVFLDSHVEANVQWLEPLLDRIKTSRANVVTPIIDIISADTFKYQASPLVKGGFNWGLNFKWDNIPKSELQNSEDFAKPFKSPTMAGGLFAMDKSYFEELGEYDPGLEIWGGENLELSFKVWMCGGQLEIIPCSRVGHVFRKRRPYGAENENNNVDSMIRNSLRVAHVWMDDYIEKYFKINPSSKNVSFGDISQRKELRKKLGCKSFQWYIENIYPSILESEKTDEQRMQRKKEEMELRFEPWNKRSRNYKRFFTLRLAETKLCVRSKSEMAEKKSKLVLGPCLKAKNYLWAETDKQELVLSKLLCLDSSSKTKIPRLMKCHELKGDQEWTIRQDKHSSAIYNMAAGLCLGVSSKNIGAKLILEVCSAESSSIWQINEIAEI